MDFELVRIVLALAMLSIASFLDLRKREVSDMLWVAFGVAAGMIYIFDFPATFTEQSTVAISLLLTAIISFGIYKSGMFGGADALGLVVFAAIMPTFSGWPATGGIVPQATFHPIASLIVLSNAIILSLFGIIVNIAKNLAYARNSGNLFVGLEHESVIRKTIALIIGHRTRKPRYAFPIETMVDRRRVFDFALKSAENVEYETRSDVWVMSGTPLLVYMFAGFTVMLIVGDLMALAYSIFRPT